MKHLKSVGMVTAIAFGALAAAGAQAGDMVKYKVVDGAIPTSLTGKPGDPANGKRSLFHAPREAASRVT